MKTRALLLALILAVPAAPLAAQDKPPRSPAPPPIVVRTADDAPAADLEGTAYARLYDAIDAAMDQQASVDSMLNSVAGQMVRNDPGLRDLEKDNPGVVAALMNELRPIIYAYSERVRLLYRPRMLALVADVMTEEEADSVAGFYSSDAGRRLMNLASQNTTAAAVANDYLEGQPPSAESVSQDLEATSRAAVAALTPEERMELTRLAMATPGFFKMSIISRRVAPIRAEMEATPPTPEEMDAIVAAVGRVLDQFAL